MNQILSTEISKNKTKTGTIEIKKILIFFAIVLIIFGLVLVIKNAIKTYQTAKDNVQVEQTAPDVTIDQGDEEVQLTINHDKPITKIIYNWNDGQDIEINGNNRTRITQTIELPNGTNILTVRIVDSIQSIATIQKEFTKVEEDINLSFTLVDNKLKITATDPNELSYITYKWNSQEEMRVDIEENAEDKTKLEVEIEIPEGLNTLTVMATSSTGKRKTKKQDIEGVASPKVSIQQDGEYLIINVKDENIVTLINYTITYTQKGYDQPYRINLTAHEPEYYNAIEGLSVKTNEQNQIIEVEYRQLMAEKGENILSLTAENKRDAQSKYEGKCTNQ